MSSKSEQSQQQPGADRFWGQFSQSKAGRTDPGDENGEGTHDDPGSGPGNPGGTGHDAHCLEWCPICRSAEVFRSTVSPELSKQAESIQHEAMGVFKAFLDAYAEKAGQPGAGPASNGSRPQTEPEDPPGPRVTDIPLD